MKRSISILVIIWLISFTAFGQEKYSTVKDIDFLFNGKLKLFDKKAHFLKTIGKPDKIETFLPECGFYAVERENGARFKFYKKGNLQYLLYNNDADFDEILFSENSDDFVLYKKTKISRQTTLLELKKLFPNSFKDFLSEKNAKIFRLKFDIQGNDDQLHMTIKNKKVVGLRFWTPC